MNLKPQFLAYLANPSSGIFRDYVWLAMRAILFLLAHPGGLRVVTVLDAPEQASLRSHQLFPVGTRIRQEIRYEGSDAKEKTEEQFPELQVHEVRDSLVMENWSYQSAIWKENLVIPSREDPAGWRLGGPRDSNYPTGIIATRNRMALARIAVGGPEIDRAVFVGSRSPHTWAHWLINYLPSVYLLNARGLGLAEVPLLLPSHIPDDSHWRESLSHVLGSRKTLLLSKDYFSRVGELYWVDAPFYDTPFASDPARRTSTSLHLEAMTEVRETFLLQLEKFKLNFKLPKHFFLARGPGSKRPYNQDEVISLASGFGIETVYLEKLSFWEKVQLFRDAKVIVGPEGSGMANVLFSSEKTRVLTWWAGETNATDNFLFNVAAVAGADYSTAPAEWTSYSGNSDQSYKVDLRPLKSALRAM